MNVAVIGAGKKRSGIGEYIARYFHKNGANVSAVLGTTNETSERAALALGKYGIEARPFTNFEEMADRAAPDAVVIASPAATHYDYLVKCIDSGFNVFCEKPLVWGGAENRNESIEDLFEKAKEKQLTVAMNSQWPFSIRSYEDLCGKITIGASNTFFFSSSPSSSGTGMIPESIPHALSLLYYAFGPGALRDLDFESIEERKIVIGFTYDAGLTQCLARIRLETQETQPRYFSYGFNGRIVTRSLDLSDYAIFFNFEGKKIRIADPLELSVGDFINAADKKTDPLVGYSHILNNLSLLRRIDDRYGELAKGQTWRS